MCLPCSGSISTSLQNIQTAAVDRTLHSKPWAGHLVKERNSTDTVHAPTELRIWWGNTEPSTHRAFIPLTFTERVLCISYRRTCRGFRTEQGTAEPTVQQALCSVVRLKERYLHLKLQEKGVGCQECHGKGHLYS